MKRLYLYDDEKAREFQPFALTRPVSELRAGAEIIRRRWERAGGVQAYGFIGAPHLTNFEELDAPPASGGETTVPSGSVIANSRCVVALSASLDETSAAFSCDGKVCAVRLSRSVNMSALAEGKLALESMVPDVTPTPVTGRWLADVWDLIGQLAVQLSEDIPVLGALLSGAAIENGTVLGKQGFYCETGANIEPFVVLDTSDGPILIRRGATISAFTRIVGPCYVGEDTTIVGDAIRACSIGDVCKIRGEISGSVILGHSNKAHTGFVGSSYLGRWVNLGAGTTTSNLKNTYGEVQLRTPSGLRNTGLQFLGSLVGDHAKTGIGTMLTTGSVIGAGANIFGGAGAPKYVPPFSWGSGEPYDRFQVDKFVEVVDRMMARRHVTLGEKGRLHLADAYRESERTR